MGETRQDVEKRILAAMLADKQIRIRLGERTANSVVSSAPAQVLFHALVYAEKSNPNDIGWGLRVYLSEYDLIEQAEWNAYLNEVKSIALSQNDLASLRNSIAPAPPLTANGEAPFDPSLSEGTAITAFDAAATTPWFPYNPQGRKREVATAQDLERVVRSEAYSGCLFQSNYRTNENFIAAYFLVLDFDNTDSKNIFTLAQAKTEFGAYQKLICTTKSHQRDKHGVIADRFRIIIPFEASIVSVGHYRQIMKYYAEKYPWMDLQATPSSQPFQPTLADGGIIENSIGNASKAKARVPAYDPRRELKANVSYMGELASEQRGLLSKFTVANVVEGFQGGNRFRPFFLSAMDFKAQGYSLEDAASILAHGFGASHLPDEYRKRLEYLWKRSPETPFRRNTWGYQWIRTAGGLAYEPTRSSHRAYGSKRKSALKNR